MTKSFVDLTTHSPVADGDVFLVRDNATNQDKKVLASVAKTYFNPAEPVPLHTTGFSLHDSMYSWWARPMSLRYTDDDNNKTYQTFTRSDGSVGVFIHDHVINRTDTYILDTDRVPDDHNAGSITVGDNKVAVVFGGRSNTAAPDNESLICQWDQDDTPLGSSFSKYYLAVGRDYPTLYQYAGDTILVLSQRGGAVLSGEPNFGTLANHTTGHAFMTNTWPLGAGAGSWSAKRFLTQTVVGDPNQVPDWMYMTSRRNADDPSIIDLAFGFHPENEPTANVYKAQIRHLGGASPWRLYVNGSEIANLSTGVGLPVGLSSLELAYTAGGSEKTRLYDVKGDSFVLTSYTGTDTANSVYKYVYKSGGTWNEVTLGNCGLPFYIPSSYFGGAAISDTSDEIIVSENIAGYSRFSRYTSANGGVSWTKEEEKSFSFKNGASIVHGRPLAENRSLSTLTRGDVVQTQITGHVGRFSSTDFTDFNSSLTTISPYDESFALNAWEANGQVIASEGVTMSGDKMATIASLNSSITERERAATLGDSGSSITTRNTAAVGSRNMTFTGLYFTSITDNWIMGSLGSNASTIAKDYSGMVGCNACSIDVPDALSVAYNVMVSSDTCTADSNSSFAFVGASRSCDINGDFSAIIASEGCNITQTPSTNTGKSAFIASINGENFKSRSYQIGSVAADPIGSGDVSEANGTGAGLLSSVNCVVTGDNSVVLGGTRVLSTTANAICGGYNASGAALSTNRKWLIQGQTGAAFFSGTVTQSHTFADIAKMVENGEDSEIEAGYILTLIGDKVYKAKAGESISGVVAATPSVIHNDTPFHWQGRYILDDFGKEVKEEKEFVRYESYEGEYEEGMEIPSNAVIFKKVVPLDEESDVEIDWVSWPDTSIIKTEFQGSIPSFARVEVEEVSVENPDYDPTIDNTPRSERPDEWTMLGVHGLLRVRTDATVTQTIVDTKSADRELVYVTTSSVDGVGELSETPTKLQVMKVEKEYDQDKGYGVTLCLLS